METDDTSAVPDLTISFIAVTDDSMVGPDPAPAFVRRLLRFARTPLSSDGLALLKSEEVFRMVSGLSQDPDGTSLEIGRGTLTLVKLSQRTCITYFARNRSPGISSRMFGRDLSLLLANFSRGMIHSSALLLDGHVALLLAPDEGGKTTAISLASRGIPLSDDQNILHVENDSVTVYPTPWTTLPYTGKSGPLGGMFLLKQGPAFKLEPIKPREVLAYLWHEHAHCSQMLPKPYRMKFFEILHAACTSVPCYRLTFSKDFLDWEAVDRAMNPQ